MFLILVIAIILILADCVRTTILIYKDKRKEKQTRFDQDGVEYYCD